jgi:methylated-DNA-[protein]-cysteine S-methyltransferase
MNTIHYSIRESSFGPLLLRAQGEKLSGLFFADQPHARMGQADGVREDELEIFVQAMREVEEFARGERREFEVETVATGTAFQQRVWREIAGIPYGETVTYGEIAKRMGASSAVRAVGTAVGRNPLSLIVPCHRVVGSAGAMTGYAGGLDRKRRLLALEQEARLQVAAT